MTPMILSAELQPGTIIAEQYRISAHIGSGGAGAVYAAVDLRSGNTIALKRLLLPGPEAATAFRKEVALLRSLRHPQLPALYDQIHDAAGDFLVMEYIPGDDLATLLSRRREPFALPQVLAWADTLLQLLENLHTRRPPIIHRDIKPQNLKLTPDGRLVLVDFGLARSIEAGQTNRPTVIGYTLEYAPIEQIQGGASGPHNDLYAVGATLYHLLSGTAPADAVTRAAALVQGSHDPLVPLATLNPQLPQPVCQAIHAALSLRIAERPASAESFRSAIHQQVITPSRPAYTGATRIVRNRPAAAAISHSTWVLLSFGVIALLIALLLLAPPFPARQTPTVIQPTAIPALQILDQRLIQTIEAGDSIGSAEQPADRLAVSPNGRMLAVAYADGTLVLRETADVQKIARTLSSDAARTETLLFSPDSTLLISGDVQGRVRIWRVRDGHLFNTLRKHYQGVTALAISPDGTRLATASTDDTVRIWDLSSGAMFETESYYDPSVDRTVDTYSMVFAADGNSLYLGLADGAIVLRRLDQRTDTNHIIAHNGPVFGLTFSPDGRSLLSSGGSSIRLWRSADLSPLLEIPLDDTVTNAAIFDNSARMLIAAGTNQISIWSAESGALVAQLSSGGNLQQLALTPSGELLAAIHANPIQAWQLTTPPE